MRSFVSVAAIFFSLSGQACLADTLSDALQAINSAKYAEAVAPLKQLSEAGNPVAQMNYGLLHYYGRGVPENEKLAIDWLLKSAQQGNTDAMFHLGNAYTFGSETPKLVADADQEAARWYFKAANSGHADAEYHLGLLFIVGKGVQQNLQQAQYWMQQAAQHGHKSAQDYLSGQKK